MINYRNLPHYNRRSQFGNYEQEAMNEHHQVKLINLILKSLVAMNGVKVQNIDLLGESMAVFLDKQIEAKNPNAVFRTHCAWDRDKEELFLWA